MRLSVSEFARVVARMREIDPKAVEVRDFATATEAYQYATLRWRVISAAAPAIAMSWTEIAIDLRATLHVMLLSHEPKVRLELSVSGDLLDTDRIAELTALRQPEVADQGVATLPGKEGAA